LILLLDNKDSFVWNLAQALGALGDRTQLGGLVLLGLDQVVDLPRRHPVQVGLHDHREQRLVHPPASLQQ